MTDPTTLAAWVLIAAFSLSLVYEVYRATVKAGTSKHDSVGSFMKNNVAFYVVAAIVIVLLLGDFDWARWVALLFVLASILGAIVWYNPKIIVERSPAFIDWFEDVVFTGLLFVAGAELLDAIVGI